MSSRFAVFETDYILFVSHEEIDYIFVVNSKPRSMILGNQYLGSVVDVTRVNIFTIATQYKAIFANDEVVSTSNDLKNSLFSVWLNKKVSRNRE